MHKRKTLINVFLKSSLIILSGLFLLHPISVSAEPESLRFNLNECIKYALDNRHDIKAAILEAESADINVQIEKTKFSTKLKLNTEIGYFSGNPINPYSIINYQTEEGSPILKREDPYYLAQLYLNIPMIMEGTINRENAPSVKKRNFEKKLKTSQKETLTGQITSEVRDAYFNLLFQIQEVEIYKHIVELKRISYNSINAKFLEGLLPDLDLINAELELLAEEKNLDSSSEKLSLMKLELDKAIGKQGNFIIEITDIPMEIPELPDIDFILNRAMKNRSEIKGNMALYEKEKEEERYYKTSGYPSANLLAKYSFADNFNFPANDSWSVWMMVDVPLFDSGYNKKNAHLYETRAKIVSEHIENQYKQISQEVMNGYYEVGKVKKEMEAQDRENRLLNDRLNIIREKVKENLLPEVMLKEEEIKVEISNKKAFQAKYKVIQAVLNLKEIAGDSIDVLH